MAETSFPFAADSAGGGGKLVSQVDWQKMAHLWGQDCIDFSMVSSTYTAADLPLNVVLSGTNLVISPGGAWVGGFYYRNDSPLTITAPTNSTATPRIDLVVLRANMTTGSVNAAIVAGTPATTPVEPTAKRILGDVWEMPLISILLPANSGTRVLSSRRYFPSPGTVQVPFSRADASLSLPPGAFTVDMDSNNTGGMAEGFRSPTRDMVTRTLGPRQAYTPDLFTVSGKPPVENRKGYWRYIAPGTVSFSVTFYNISTTPVKVTAGWFMAFTLPVTPSKYMTSSFTGVLSNPESRDGLPNLVSITSQTRLDSSNSCALYYPNSLSLSEGLDGLATIPGKSELTLSGVYETADFETMVIGSA